MNELQSQLMKKKKGMKEGKINKTIRNSRKLLAVITFLIITFIMLFVLCVIHMFMCGTMCVFV